MAEFEACCILDTKDQLKDARIATSQAIRRAGHDPLTLLETIVEYNDPVGYGYLFSTVGMSQGDHDERITWLKENQLGNRNH